MLNRPLPTCKALPLPWALPLAVPLMGLGDVVCVGALVRSALPILLIGLLGMLMGRQKRGWVGAVASWQCRQGWLQPSYSLQE